MSNPYPRAERYRHVAIERLDGWVHSWWVCAHERRLSGAADLRLAASAALRIRAGARAACKRLRAKVADLEDRLDFSDNGWNRALEERDSALREAHEAGMREGEDAERQQFIDWRGVETPCQRCGGSGVRTYSSTATWHGGAGGQTLTSAVCDGCWGSGDATSTGANLRKLRAESDELREAHEAGLRESGKLYAEHSRALDRLLEQAEELAALRRELAARRAIDGWILEKHAIPGGDEYYVSLAPNGTLRMVGDDLVSVRDVATAPTHEALCAALGIEVTDA